MCFSLHAGLLVRLQQNSDSLSTEAHSSRACELAGLTNSTKDEVLRGCSGDECRTRRCCGSCDRVPWRPLRGSGAMMKMRRRATWFRRPQTQARGHVDVHQLYAWISDVCVPFLQTEAALQCFCRHRCTGQLCNQRQVASLRCSRVSSLRSHPLCCDLRCLAEGDAALAGTVSSPAAPPLALKHAHSLSRVCILSMLLPGHG